LAYIPVYGAILGKSMPSNDVRHNIALIISHWILALTVLIALGLGWSIQYVPNSSDLHNFLLNLHTSIGLTIAILALIQIIFRIMVKTPFYPDDFPQWQKILSGTLYVLIYLSVVLLLTSGYFQAIFSGTAVLFWGAPLPGWGAVDLSTAELFRSTHRVIAFILAGSIIAYIGISGLNTIRRPGIAARMLSGGTQAQEEPGSPIGLQIGHNLARNLRVFGWIAFWSQLVLALICGVLLEFATSGRAFSPGAVGGFGDAIYWGVVGFLLLCFAIPVAFYYTRAARKILARPDYYLSKIGVAPFWFLLASLVIGGLGILIGFIGVSWSISLLIVKTVSQPPGIAITDPSKIVRALDVFILLVNFDLLLAHFIGGHIALWLITGVPRARLKYLSASGQSTLPARVETPSTNPR
jgi:cytochrome b561